MSRFVITLVVAVACRSSSLGAVIVVGNFTDNPVTFTVAEPNQKEQAQTLPAYQVIPIWIAGPGELEVGGPKEKRRYHIEAYNAYGFIPDPDGGVQLQGVELPGEIPERDRKPDPAFIKPAVLKIPVTLLLDDADPRADALWQADLKERLTEAAVLIESACGVRFEFTGFARWKIDPMAKDIELMLSDFEDKVELKPGRVAVGWSHRSIEEKRDAPFGICRGVPYGHVLIRDGRLRDKNERTEVLAHYLAKTLGAIPIHDPGSVMRPTLGDGKARLKNFTFRLDPLNALAMNIWADELRRGPLNSIENTSAITRLRLIRVYKALMKASPGSTHALTYLNDLEKAPAAKKDPDDVRPKQPNNPLANPERDGARQVCRAVTARARANTGAARLSGDDLTAAYVRAAADESMKIPEKDRASAFLLGIAVALDDTGALLADARTAEVVKGIENEAEFTERVAVLGNPTLHGRRDLRRCFAIGCGAAEAGVFTESEAADAAAKRFIAELNSRSGAGFPGMTADLSGAGFARAVRNDPGLIIRARDKFTADEFVPAISGLRDGFSTERFKEDFGSTTDERFTQIVAAIRANIKKLPVYAK